MLGSYGLYSYGSGEEQMTILMKTVMNPLDSIHGGELIE